MSFVCIPTHQFYVITLWLMLQVAMLKAVFKMTVHAVFKFFKKMLINQN